MHPQKSSFKFLVILLGRETILKRFKAAYTEILKYMTKKQEIKRARKVFKISVGEE